MKISQEELEKLSSNLHSAMMRNDLVETTLVINQFLEHRVAIDNAIYLGVAPIFRAIQSGNIDIVRAILNAGASIYLTLINGRSPLDFAVKGTEIYNLLENYKSDKLPLHQNRDIDSSEEHILFIRPDGNCMYNAIIEGYRRLGSDNVPDLETLREWVHSRVTYSRGEEHEAYIRDLEIQLVNLIATFPRSSYNLEDIAGFNLEIYNIIRPYITLYDSDINVLDSIRRDRAVEQYTKTILNDGNWGRNVELWAMSRVLGIEIVVHTPDFTTRINNTGNEHPPSIHLRLAGNHYDLITHYSANEELLPIVDDTTIAAQQTEAEIIHLDNIYPADNSMAMLCVAALFIGVISSFDDNYFQW